MRLSTAEQRALSWRHCGRITDNTGAQVLYLNTGGRVMRHGSVHLRTLESLERKGLVIITSRVGPPSNPSALTFAEVTEEGMKHYLSYEQELSDQPATT